METTEMKPLDGFAPSEEDTAKLNEIGTWLNQHGYNGIMLIHKESVGVSWIQVKNADEVRHTIINSLGHIATESPLAAISLIKGMDAALKQIKEG